MGATAGTKTPLAGQARVSQAAAASAPADDYFDKGKFNTVQDTYQKTLGRNPTQEELRKNYSSVEDLERSLQAQRPAPQLARRPSPFGVKRFR